MTTHVRLVGLLLALVAATTTPAFAGQGWEIEAHGGVFTSTNPDRGTSGLPPVGPDIPLNGPLPTSITRQVPSWYFGDGAAILNEIIGIRSPARIAPLDPLLTSRIVDRQSGGSVGIRVDLGLTPRFGVEFAFDAARGHLALRQASKSLVAASAASFSPVWNVLLGFPSGSTQTVTSDATLDDKQGHQLVTSGSLLVNLLTKSAFTPYVTAGAGYIAAGDDAPSVTLAGNYSFTFPPTVILPAIPQAHINQTDTVKVQAVAKNTMTWVFGGGVKYALGDHWGVRGDLRDYVNRDVVRTVVSTTPSSVFGTPSGTLTFAFTQTAPLIVFSTSPLTVSTLSTTLNDLQTFKGRGIVNQVNASAGIYWRF
jgi:opacity protein-like surface antigen